MNVVHAPFMRSHLDLYAVFASDSLVEVLEFPFCQGDLDVHAVNCHSVASAAPFMSYWRLCGLSQCEVVGCAVGVVRTSGTMVVSFSDPMMRKSLQF